MFGFKKISTRIVVMAMDERVIARDGSCRVSKSSWFSFALDTRSVRNYDNDGRLHVSVANISKATVNPYVGNEIPDWQRLGLQSDKIYYLYRDPDELKKAAATFNGLPLLSEHQPVTSDTHDKKLTIGATGTDAVFDFPYLKNSLVIWPDTDIKDVQNETKRQLSCGYRYTADMTPGVSPDGEKYDGVMREIIGNHVALVKEGRAGSDVVVGDSKAWLQQRKASMAKTMTRQAAAAIGVVAPYVRGLLAQDQSIDLRPIFKGVSATTWEGDKQRILRGVQRLTNGKLAQDTNIGELAEMLDMVEAHPDAGDTSVSKAQHNAMEAAAHGHSTLGIPKKVGKEFADKDKGKTFDRKRAHDEEEDEGMDKDELHEKLHKHLRDKLTADDLEHVHELVNAHHKDKAEDEGPEDEPEDADLDHEEDEEEDRESDEFDGGEDEDSPSGEQKLEELGAADEEEYTDSTPKQEDRDDETEWRRGSMKKPATDRKRAHDRHPAHDKHAKDRKRAHDRKAKDEPPPFKGRPRPGGGMDRRHGMDSKRKLVTQDELNTTVSKAVEAARKAERAISVAKDTVRPWTGDLPVGMSFDSADAVYAHALKTAGIDTKGVHPSAFPALLKLAPKPGTSARGNVVSFKGANDSKAATSFADRNSETMRIRRL